MLRALSLSTAILLAGIRPQGYTAYAQQPEGFTVYDPSSLDVSLGSSCIEALSAIINCVPWVQTFTQLSYRGSLELELTDALCSTDCGSSLKTWFDSVATQCAGQTLNGAIPTKFGGFMWAGYNETCIRDPRPPKPYCNGMLNVIEYRSLYADFLSLQTSLTNSPMFLISSLCLAQSSATLATSAVLPRCNLPDTLFTTNSIRSVWSTCMQRAVEK
jgi:hypothetical protein